MPAEETAAMKTTRFVSETVRVVLVVANTIVCGFLLCVAVLGLSGDLADAGVWENQGYGALSLLGALIAGENSLVLFPEYHELRALRRLAYAANAAVVTLGFYVFWGVSTSGTTGGLSPESLICWGFGSLNIAGIAMTGD